MKHLIETTDLSSLGNAEYDRLILVSTTNEIVYRGGVKYEIIPNSYIYNEADNKYYQKLVAYGEPIKINSTVDLNSQWVSDTEDNDYSYFKSDTYEYYSDIHFSQCKVTWSNLKSITFKYMSSSSSDIGSLFVSKLDGEKFTDQSNDDDIYMTTDDKTPGTYNEFTIECDEGEHHIWFCYVIYESATDEDRGFIGVPKSVISILDVKQGSELPTEYNKYGGISAEGGKIYDIYFNKVTLPNGSIVGDYKNVEKTEKAINTEYVDLGLKSGTLWAKCNIGATTETDYGVYFQWGETSGISGSLVGKYSDENYSLGSYTHCNGSYNTLKKYNNNSSYGTVDNKTTLESVDDAATQIMGGDWRMPTKAEIQELIDYTTNEWVEDFNGTGVNGRKFTGPNGNSIFIPAAGDCGNGSVENVGHSGLVWSSLLYTSYSGSAWYLNFHSGDCDMRYYERYEGWSVRGVRK